MIAHGEPTPTTDRFKFSRKFFVIGCLITKFTKILCHYTHTHSPRGLKYVFKFCCGRSRNTPPPSPPMTEVCELLGAASVHSAALVRWHGILTNVNIHKSHFVTVWGVPQKTFRILALPKIFLGRFLSIK